MKRLFLLVFSFYIFIYLFAAPLAAHAQIDWNSTGCVNHGVATLQCIPAVFSNVVRAALIFAGAVAVILIIYGGIRLIYSGGDAKQVQGARQIITYAIIGLILILSAFGIILLIGYLTNTTTCITDLNAINNGGCK
jgi:hypothetical protein